MQGKTVIVTGATNGIGEITARELARAGAEVVIISRSAEKCQKTVRDIQTQTGNQHVSYIAADLSSLAEMRRAADEFKAKHKHLHVLVNNAGAIFNERQVSPDGYEMTFALNHLSYFLLTHLLLDMLKATAAKAGEARIINVSSDAHQAGNINFDDLQREKNYTAAGFGAYGDSKLMNVMFTYELAERLQGSQVTANVLHPGFVRTGFGHNNAGMMNLILGMMQFFALTPEKGAETSLHLAMSPEVKGVSGKYFAKKQPKKTTPASYDRAAWQKLWQISEQLTGIPQTARV
jgi:NAD(P)-dependent dehydrogenase (short-subunit alcohol dehydrogenase family)